MDRIGLHRHLAKVNKRAVEVGLENRFNSPQSNNSMFTDVEIQTLANFYFDNRWNKGMNLVDAIDDAIEWFLAEQKTNDSEIKHHAKERLFSIINES